MSLKITEEEYKKRFEDAFLALEKHLNITKYYDGEDLVNYYDRIKAYIKTRIALNSFSENLIGKVVLLKELGYGEEDILKMIYNFPSLLHMDKKDVLIKYLLLGKITNSETNTCERDNIMINHTRDLMGGKDILYARIMYFLNYENSVVRKPDITRRKVLKITNNEFAKSYKVSKEDLLKLFPYTDESFNLICSWKENNEILRTLLEKGLKLK